MNKSQWLASRCPSTSTLRSQIHRSRLAQSGNKRIELTLTPEEQKLLGPRPAQALKEMIKAELEKAK